MKRWIFPFCLLAALAVAPARAEDADLHPSAPAVRKAVIATIEGQLAAFRAHDPGKAYGFAARALRRQFPLPRFAEVVRTGYPEIWRNLRAEYGIVSDNGARATLNVRVHTADTSAAYDYVLVREPDGWRISGVLRHAPQPADSV